MRFKQRLHKTRIDSARFVDRHKIAVYDHAVEGRYVAIASGSTPTPLPFFGAEHLLMSDDFLDLDDLPETIVFVGGGHISFEFAHVAARAGAKPTILHGQDWSLAQFDHDLVKRLLDKSRHAGIDIRFDRRVAEVEKGDYGVKVWAKSHGANQPFEAAAMVHGAGRVPEIDDLELSELDVETVAEIYSVEIHLRDQGVAEGRELDAPYIRSAMWESRTISR